MIRHLLNFNNQHTEQLDIWTEIPFKLEIGWSIDAEDLKGLEFQELVEWCKENNEAHTWYEATRIHAIQDEKGWYMRVQLNVED